VLGFLNNVQDNRSVHLAQMMLGVVIMCSPQSRQQVLPQQLSLQLHRLFAIALVEMVWEMYARITTTIQNGVIYKADWLHQLVQVQ
jgi:hypothetical protein